MLSTELGGEGEINTSVVWLSSRQLKPLFCVFLTNYFDINSMEFCD